MDQRERQGNEPAHRHPWELSRACAIEHMLLTARLPPWPSLLDVGCGDGWLLARLSQRLAECQGYMPGQRQSQGSRQGRGQSRRPGQSNGQHSARREGQSPARREGQSSARREGQSPGQPMSAPSGPGRLVGVDPWLDDSTRAALLAAPVPVETVTSLKDVSPGGFHAVLLLDVLEHVEDDVGLLSQAAALAAPDGIVFVTVPAHPVLFGAQDEALCHLRRYSRSSLLDLLEAAGLIVQVQGALFASLLLPRLASVLTERLMGVSLGSRGVGGWRHGSLVTAPITAALNLDNALLDALSRAGLTTTGLSLWARCCRK